MPFLQFAGTVDHPVMVGNDTSFERLLTHDEEIVVGAHNCVAHECAGEDVSHLGSAVSEESLAVSEVDHDDGQVELDFVGF